MKIAIFANGAISRLDKIPALLRSCDLLIAADGGARHCRMANVFPHIVIGDFDSLTPAELDEYQAHGTRFIRYPSRKDFTDLELALEFACDQGADQIIILGGLGLRWDQTLANILLLAQPSYGCARISLLDGSQEITLICETHTLEISGQPGDTVSLIPIRGNAEGITTFGLEYPLSNETLQFGASRGVSNVMLGNRATIHLEHGLLICTVIHQEVEK